jgi:F-type H+-transporting ATPase subunit delta
MTAENYAKALYDAVSEVRPEDQDKVLDNFLKILVQNGDLKLMPEIETHFESIKNKASGIQEIEVITAREHPEIIKMVNEHVDKDAVIKHKIDSGLVGGVVVRIDDLLIDGSIKNSLQELKKTMKG